MPDLSVQRLTWHPAGRDKPVLTAVTLDVPAGQRVVLAGPSGSGKSTLLRALAGVLQQNDVGRYAGSVTVAGVDPRLSGRVGLLAQEPSDAVVAHRVGRDVAFGLENLGVPREQLWDRVRVALQDVQFPYGTEHLVSRLSGGERQRLALAGVMVLRPGLLLLDEPTSMLDPETAATVRAAIQQAAADVAATTVVVEHRLDGWVSLADRLVVLGREGSVVADGPLVPTLARESAALAARGVWVPGMPRPSPVPIPARLVAPVEPVDGWIAVAALGVRLGERPALRGVDARVTAGSVLGVAGRSGAGKSTLLSVLAGVRRPSTGEVEASATIARGLDRSPYRWRSAELARRVGWVPQQSEHGVVRHLVRDDVRATGLAVGRPEAWLAERVEGLLDALGLREVASSNPYRLSGGEQRRLTLATALAHGPDVLLLDEPTVGQDRLTWAAVVGAVESARAAGSAVALATHDADALEQLADQSVRLVDGGVVPDLARRPT